MQVVEFTRFFDSISIPRLPSILKKSAIDDESLEALHKGEFVDSRQMKMTAMGVLLSSVFVITAEAQRGPQGPQDESAACVLLGRLLGKMGMKLKRSDRTLVVARRGSPTNRPKTGLAGIAMRCKTGPPDLEPAL